MPAAGELGSVWSKECSCRALKAILVPSKARDRLGAVEKCQTFWEKVLSGSQSPN